MTTPHQIVNPNDLTRPVGFAHAVVSAPGRTVYLGGQGGLDRSGRMVGPGLTQQFDMAATSIVTALRATGGQPEHLVSMQIYVTDIREYRTSLKEVGDVYRKHFGRHYPALALFEVKGLMEPEAKVELWCVAVLPNGQG